jgi:acyl-CoA thioester hydrolase
MNNEQKAKNVTYYRVIYGDCDSMSIVYYSNYLKLFEIGRTELLRELGTTYREVEERGFFLPATEAYLKYIKPALYDDLLKIKTMIGFVKRASSRFDYTIYRGEDIIVQGYTIHACLNRENRIRKKSNMLLNCHSCESRNPVISSYYGLPLPDRSRGQASRE